MAPSGRMPALPAGFRFHPTDEELIVHYLMNQAAAVACPVPIIAEVNIYQCNPWDLPAKAVFGDKEWYFFSPRDRKYPNGARPNRAAGSGYWKATGTDRAIVSTPTSHNIGVKKALVFYRGKPPRGVKTDWIMHEYRLTPASSPAATGSKRARPSGSSMRLDDWVLCRIYKKSNDFQLQMQQLSSDQEQEEGSTVLEEAAAMNSSSNASSPKSELALPAGDDDDDPLLHPLPGAAIPKSCSLTDLLATMDYSTLSQLLLGAPDPSPAPTPIPPIYATPPPCQTLRYDNSSNNINARSFEDGDDLTGKLQLPGDSRISGGFGGATTSSYCGQQLAVDESGFQFQYSGSLLMSHSLLLSNHLQMQ